MAVVLPDAGSDLARAGIDVELRGVGTLERVRQVVVVVVGRGHRGADIRRRRDGVAAYGLVEAAGRRRGGERRRIVVRSAGRARPRRRPRAVSVRVRRPYLHLVDGAFGEAWDRRVGGADVLRPVRPAAARPHPVLQVVTGDRGAARVVRRAPAYVEARGAPRGRDHHRRDRPRRRLVPVVDVEGDVDRVVAAVAVVGLHRYRVTGLRLAVVSLAGFGPDLAGSGNDVELRGVGPLERVRQGIVVVVVRGHCGADIRRRRDDLVAEGLVETAGRRRAGEFRRVVRRAGRTRPRRRPITVPLRVRRPYLYLVGGTLRQVRDRRAGAGEVLRPVGPGAARPRPVLQVVAGDRGAARVVRRGPVHVEAREAPRSRGHRRRGGRRGRRLGGG